MITLGFNVIFGSCGAHGSSTYPCRLSSFISFLSLSLFLSFRPSDKLACWWDVKQSTKQTSFILSFFFFLFLTFCFFSFSLSYFLSSCLCYFLLPSFRPSSFFAFYLSFVLILYSLRLIPRICQFLFASCLSFRLFTFLLSFTIPFRSLPAFYPP